MAAKEFTAYKAYEDCCFVLNERKLRRIVEVVKERLDRLKDDCDRYEQYAVVFKDRKQMRVDSLEGVLELDNSNKNPINRFVAILGLEVDNKAICEIKVEFFAKSSFDNSIELFGFSNDMRWLQETIDAVEEQLERTIQNEIAYKINGLSPPVLLIILTIFSALFLAVFGPEGGLQQVPEHRVREFILMGDSARTQSDKVDYIFKYLSATLERDTASEAIARLSRDYRTYLIGIPLLVGFLSALIAFFFFYPRNVFSWGDCAEKYERTIEHRKFLWYGVVLSIVTGVLGNLFVAGLVT